MEQHTREKWYLEDIRVQEGTHGQMGISMRDSGFEEIDTVKELKPW
jgi:hypothetical protein